jgi:hypothetical protein
LTRRTDSIIALILLTIFLILLVLDITILGAIFIFLFVGFLVSILRISSLHRTPLRIGLSSNGIHITRGVLRKTSFLPWSDVESIRVTRVVPSFAEPKEQVAVMMQISGTRILKIPNEMMVSVVKDLARKIVATSGKPLKKGSATLLA